MLQRLNQWKKDATDRSESHSDPQEVEEDMQKEVNLAEEKADGAASDAQGAEIVVLDAGVSVSEPMRKVR